MTTLDLTVATRDELVAHVGEMLALPDAAEHVVDRVLLPLRKSLQADAALLGAKESGSGPSDADLTAIIEAATPGWDWGSRNQPEHARYLDTFDPQMVASLLARAQAAEAKATSIAIDAGLRIGDAEARYEIAHESFMLSQRDCDNLRVQLAAAERERDELAQAIWDARAILGYDNDGDPGPGAAIAGAKYDYAKFAEGWLLRECRELIADYDACPAPEDLAAAEAKLRAVEALADEWPCHCDAMYVCQRHELRDAIRGGSE